MINPRFVAALAAALALIVPSSSLRAQAAPAPPPPPAMLRAWLFPAEASDTASIAIKGAAQEQPVTLVSTSGGARQVSPGYREVKEGATAIEVKSGDQLLASGNVSLAGGRQYTLIAWRSGPKWELKAFPDSSPSSNAADRPLRLINFADGRETLVSINGADGTKLADGSVQEVRLKPKVLDIAVQVMAPDGGPPFQTSTAFDLAQADSAYVVVAPDYRGRPDAQVLAGGTGPPPPPPVPLAAVVPPTAEELRKQQIGARRLELDYRQAQLAALKAMEQGPNKIPNAEALKRDIEKQIKDLQGPASTPAVPPGSAPQR